MTPEELKAFYKEAFKQTIENMKAKEKDYAKYFSKDFVMNIDGQQYVFEDYVEFMSNLRKETASVQVDFKEMIAEGDHVATVHTTNVIKENGKEFSVDVMSFFKIEHHRFVSGYELTRRGR